MNFAKKYPTPKALGLFTAFGEDVRRDNVEGPELKITKENASSWNMIFNTLSNISSIEVVDGGGYT
jgi:hypothetical protein